MLYSDRENFLEVQISDPAFRPEIAPTTPGNVKFVMKSCWDANPATRPTMRKVFELLLRCVCGSILSRNAMNSILLLENLPPEGSQWLLKSRRSDVFSTICTPCLQKQSLAVSLWRTTALIEMHYLESHFQGESRTALDCIKNVSIVGVHFALLAVR